MNTSFEISALDDLLLVTLKGNPSVDDIKHILDKTRDASGYSHTARLWDFRDASFNFSQHEILELASYASVGDDKPSRVAMLVGEDLSFGVSRIYEAFRHNELTRINVFRDKAKAIAWLQE